MASYGSVSRTPPQQKSGEHAQVFTEETEDDVVESVMTSEGPKFKVTRTTRLSDSVDTRDIVDERSPLTPNVACLPSTSERVMVDHCHTSTHGNPGIDKKARRQLLIASTLCLLFMLAEIIGGVLANSLALATDAAHLLTDFASFLISLFALYMAARPATRSMSFGWHRAEVMGALVSVLMIWVVTGILVYMAAERVTSGEYELNGLIMVIVASLGVVFNLIMLFTLHDHGHSHGGHGHSHGGHGHSNSDTKTSKTQETVKDMSYQNTSDSNLVVSQTSDAESGTGEEEKHKRNINVRAAFIHVLGDLLQSFGVLIAALIVYFKPEYKIADPICTFIFSVLVLATTINILRDTLNVLMEGTPPGISFDSVQECLTDIPGVHELHNLRIWSLTTDRVAVAVHLALASDANHLGISQKAGAILRKTFNIYECTIQTEQFVDEMKDCTQCQNPAR